MIDIPLSKYSVLIPLLNALSTFDLFQKDRTDLNTEALPFFINYDLLEAKSFSCVPFITMEYLWNPFNNDIIKLDGTRNAVFDNLGKLGPLINERTLVGYLRFVLAHTQNEEGTLRLTQEVSEIEYCCYPDDEDMAYLHQHVAPAAIRKEGEKYYVSCTIIYGSHLYRTEIVVEENGMFDFIDEVQLDREMLCLRPILLE